MTCIQTKKKKLIILLKNLRIEKEKNKTKKLRFNILSTNETIFLFQLNYSTIYVEKIRLTKQDLKKD